MLVEVGDSDDETDVEVGAVNKKATRVQVTVVEQGATPEVLGAPKLSAITVLSPNISSVTALHAETIETRGCIDQTSMPPSLGGKMPVWMSKKPRLQQQPA